MKQLSTFFKLSLLFLTTFLFSCGGGGSGDGSSLSNNACGVLGLNTKVINGTSCSGLSASSVVRVSLQNSDGSINFCTGVMISSLDVLTAAHCFVNNPVSVSIVVGDSDDQLTTVSARSFVTHPGFRTGDTALFNDLAVIQLSSEVDLPVLPILTSTSLVAAEEVAIFGYGEDEDGDSTFDELRSGEMLVSEVTANHIRADFNGDGSNTCLGDSGGPLISNKLGVAAIVGITSTGTRTDCGEGDNSFFANTQGEDNLNFIRLIVSDLGEI